MFIFCPKCHYKSKLQIPINNINGKVNVVCSNPNCKHKISIKCKATPNQSNIVSPDPISATSGID